MDLIETPQQTDEETGSTTAKFSRRRLLGLAAVGPAVLVGLGAATARAAKAPAAAPCFDLNAMPSSQLGMRRTLNFKPQSADPNKRCGGCAFFHATAGDCGKCDILSGGPTSAVSVCDSWAKKA